MKYTLTLFMSDSEEHNYYRLESSSGKYIFVHADNLTQAIEVREFLAELNKEPK